MSDWIEWCGGECPVAGDLVAVEHRSGDFYTEVLAGEDEAEDWSHDGGPADIIAYRIHKES